MRNIFSQKSAKMRRRAMADAALELVGITRGELAEMMRMSVRTLYRREADPTSWTVGELKRMGEVFGWGRNEIADFVERCAS